MKQVDHEFGGHHTELKLSVVSSYLNAYTTALGRWFEHLWYIDAFAGTGSRIVKHRALPQTLFGGPPTPERIERLRGSAQIAIDAKPPFDRLIFIEKKKSFATALQKLKIQHPERSEVMPTKRSERLFAKHPGRKGGRCYFLILTVWTLIGRRWRPLRQLEPLTFGTYFHCLVFIAKLPSNFRRLTPPKEPLSIAYSDQLIGKMTCTHIDRKCVR